jgi:tRNA nucleotidyltransferase (CCA-adding enzyme)
MPALNQELPDDEALAERLASLPGIDALREAAGMASAYLVGGAVRDLLLGRPRADVDVVVEGDPGPIAERLGGDARAHERFGTIVVSAGSLEVDLARARSETYAYPGALPDVTPASLEADLGRRDFTVNAMAIPLAAGESRLIDPTGGRGDLAAGTLRTLHANSMRDDPTRALRAARYAARYGFELEPDTEAQVSAADLGTVSDDRVIAELHKLAAEDEPRRAFELAAAWGLITLETGAGDLIDAVVDVMAREPWAGLATQADAVLAATRCDGLDEARELEGASPASPSAGAALARGRGPVTLILARALGAGWLDEYVRDWRHVRLEVTGDDLIAAGLPQGPAIGRGLAATLDAKLDGELAGREAELERALAAARESTG